MPLIEEEEPMTWKSFMMPTVIGFFWSSSTALAQQGHTLMTDWLTTGLSFNECMRHSEQVLQRAGFDVQRLQQAAGGTYGPYSAQILCAPNNVVVFIVTGPPGDLGAHHLISIKQKFVGQNR
jgi:hypothetical protein